MFYNFPGAPGNTGYLAQANPNPLTDPRFKIQGGEPWGNRPILPDEKEKLDRPFTPLLPPGQNVPLAQGALGIMGDPSALQVPFASVGGGMPMGNAGFRLGSRYAQGVPPDGFQYKTVS
jgi:hypothetical protein